MQHSESDLGIFCFNTHRLRNFLLITVFIFPFQLNAQNSFSFLNIANNARINALGGVNISLSDKDVNLFTFNPALLDSSQRGQIGLNYSPYLASTNFLSLNYAPNFINKSGNSNWAFSLQNLHYGTFQGTDALGNLTNDFSANDFSLGVTHSRKINNITFGITGKLVGSVLESYSSLAFLTDWGGTFKHPTQDLSFGIVAKNIGFMLKSYGNVRPEIPFDLQIGATFKPKYMPVRFSFTGHHLYVFDIAENNNSTIYTFDNQGNKVIKTTSNADKILRHFVLGTEVLIHKNFNLLVGYNHLRHQDLRVNNGGNGAGFSFGFLLKQKRFSVSFSHAQYAHKGQNIFSLSYNVSR